MIFRLYYYNAVMPVSQGPMLHLRKSGLDLKMKPYNNIKGSEIWGNLTNHSRLLLQYWQRSDLKWCVMNTRNQVLSGDQLFYK